MDIFLQACVNGLLMGGFYSLMGMGQNVIFGVMKIVNFCHGEMLMVGMYLTYILSKTFSIDPYLCVPLVAIIMFFLGACLILLKDTIVLMLGNKYRDAVYCLPFLVFHPIMYTVAETTNTGIEKEKKSYFYIIIGIVSCAFNYIGNSILVPMLSERGAAISTGISFIIYWGIRTYISHRLFRVDYGIVKFMISTVFLMIYETIRSPTAIIIALSRIQLAIVIKFLLSKAASLELLSYSTIEIVFCELNFYSCFIIISRIKIGRMFRFFLKTTRYAGI